MASNRPPAAAESRRLRVYVRLTTLEAAISLARYKLRSGLAVLGVAVAVMTMVWVDAIGRAGVQQAIAQLDALGDNLVWIEAGARQTNGVRSGTHGMTTLVPRDAQAIREEIGLVVRTSENVDGRVQVIGAGRNWSTQFRGVSPDYQQIKLWQVAEGEFFSADDTDRARAVAVIGATVRHELFGDDDAIGQPIRISNSWFTVIGVLAPKGASATGQDQDDTIMMPWTTAMARLLGQSQTWLDDILCSADAPEDFEIATAEIIALLRERHHIAIGAEDDFNIRKPQELLEARIKSSRTLSNLMLVFAMCALLVGGIGIMNVMLASVAQRTREIGVRLAVGARPSAIQLQFIGEALVLALSGGAIGLVVANTLNGMVERMLGWPMALSQAANVAAVLAAVAIGVCFGVYPALRASRLDPVAALYHEP